MNCTARAWRVDGRIGKGQDDTLRHRTLARLEERLGLLDGGRGGIRRWEGYNMT